jgi:hypothetical protein
MKKIPRNKSIATMTVAVMAACGPLATPLPAQDNDALLDFLVEKGLLTKEAEPCGKAARTEGQGHSVLLEKRSQL